MAGLLGSLLVTNALAQGVPNVFLTPGELISGPNAPEAGRTAVIAFHGDMLITFPEAPGSPPGDYLVRAWDISSPANPQVTQVLGYTQHGYMAHGFIKSGERLTSGYTFEVDNAGVADNGDMRCDRHREWRGLRRQWQRNAQCPGHHPGGQRQRRQALRAPHRHRVSLNQTHSNAGPASSGPAYFVGYPPANSAGVPEPARVLGASTCGESEPRMDTNSRECCVEHAVPGLQKSRIRVHWRPFAVSSSQV